MKRVTVIAPHPDDETLGCGGTLARLRGEGARLTWIIMSTMPPGNFSAITIARRELEIAAVAKLYRFERVLRLGFPAAALDTVPRGALIAKLAKAFALSAPDTIFTPHPSDAHSDHRVSFESAISASKTFRLPSLKRLAAYETLSETEFGAGETGGFHPTIFYDITRQLPVKLKALKLYKGESGAHPFPRSAANVRALALHRGATAGFKFAEAFQLIKERI